MCPLFHFEGILQRHSFLLINHTTKSKFIQNISPKLCSPKNFFDKINIKRNINFIVSINIFTSKAVIRLFDFKAKAKIDQRAYKKTVNERIWMRFGEKSFSREISGKFKIFQIQINNKALYNYGVLSRFDEAPKLVALQHLMLQSNSQESFSEPIISCLKRVPHTLGVSFGWLLWLLLLKTLFCLNIINH